MMYMIIAVLDIFVLNISIFRGSIRTVVIVPTTNILCKVKSLMLVIAIFQKT